MLNDSIQSSVVAAWGGGGGGEGAARFLSLSERECPSLRSTQIRNKNSFLVDFIRYCFLFCFLTVPMSGFRLIVKSSKPLAVLQAVSSTVTTAGSLKNLDFQ